jgi:hypothetical protein
LFTPLTAIEDFDCFAHCKPTVKLAAGSITNIFQFQKKMAETFPCLGIFPTD